MPSKTKKQSKASSRISNFEYSASPQTSTLSSSSADADINEQNVRASLEEASSRFPNLIGQSAFIGSVTSVRKSSRCTIWLSESSMVACSISPGSIVSVSLAASRIRSARTFPLTSFLEELAEHFKVELTDETPSNAGDYFALATVFPSSEVAKNGIMLSSSLSYTMGCPASESLIFVYPVEAHSISSDLFLEFVPAVGRAENKGDLKPSMNSFEEIHGKSENISTLSPRTALCQPKISSTPSSQVSAKHKAACTLSYSNSTPVDLCNMKEALKDEDTKQLLQGCATSELYSRALVCGNLVAIPILLKIFFFRVMGINKLVASSDQDLVEEKSHNSGVDHFEGAFLVNHETKVHLRVQISSAAEIPRNRAGLESKLADTNVEYDVSKLGGLGEEYATLRHIISSSLKKISSSMKNTSLRQSFRPIKGVLLHGPPGTGKTTLARLCVRDTGVNLFTVNGPELFSQYYGETEQAMQKVFELAHQAAPAVVFIDELDAIAPARAEGGEHLSLRIVGNLLTLMDGISRSDRLLVIAATNRPESIEPALRRHGRFGKEIEIGVPSPSQRLDILQTILGDMKHSLSRIKIEQLALATHGFVGADLAALCNEAALVCLRRHARSKEICNTIQLKKFSILHEDISNSLHRTSDCLVGVRDILNDSTDSASSDSPSSSSGGPKISKETLDFSSDSTEALFDVGKYSLEVSFEDFEKARLKVRPSAMREIILQVPKVNWEDVGGQVEVKNQLKEAVLLSENTERACKQVGVNPPSGILMFGPPGCSKTLMARAVASEANLNFLAVKGPELYSKWVGESEKAVRSLFAKARANAPSVIFFDEIDGLAVIRGKESDGVSVSDRVMNQLLGELDGLHKRVGVTVIAATNRPDKIDPALLRPGRFDRILYVGPPNESDREDIFRIHLRNFPCCSDVSIKELAGLTEGYTGADISLICREAMTEAIAESYDASELDGSEIDVSKVKVTFQHFKSAIAQVEPTETHSYQQLSDKYQRFVSTSNRGDDQKKWSPHIHQIDGSSSLIKTFMRFLFGFFIRRSEST